MAQDNIIKTHRGGPDRIQFHGFPHGAELLLPPPDSRWDVGGHIQGRAWSDKYRFNGKSDTFKREFQRYYSPIKTDTAIVTHVVPMLSPFFGGILRIRCGCPGMELSVVRWPIICNPDYPGDSEPFIVDVDNEEELIGGIDMGVPGETYHAWQPDPAGGMAVQNYAVGIKFTKLPDGGIWGDCCNKGCCPQFEMVTLGIDACFQDDFQGDCTSGRCPETWTPPRKCVVVEPCSGDVGAVSLNTVDPFEAPAGSPAEERKAGDDDKEPPASDAGEGGDSGTDKTDTE